MTILLFTGCTQQPSVKLEKLSYGSYKEVDFKTIASWEHEDFTKALDVYLHTCNRTQTKDLYKVTCQKAKALNVEDKTQAKLFFEENFTPFVSLSKKSLATGYFEPLLQGSLDQSETYPYPLYAVPDDLLRVELSSTYKQRLSHPLRGRLIGKKIKPYFTREEINNAALGDLKPICYVNDKVDLFFLQVQGSGCIELEDKSVLNVGYADQNGFPYVSIGNVMIQKGLLKREEVSLQSIREYLYTNPNRADEILNANPSYIFFEQRSHSASGALGLVLEAERSVAVDKKNIPLGMPLFISTTDPLTNKPYERMVFAHDTGGAIKGEARLDIFYGRGKRAQEKAGKMKNSLKLWILIPNDYLSKDGIESH